MSDTPRTDEAAVSREFIAREMDHYAHKFVLADFARQLERELAEARRDALRVCRGALWQVCHTPESYDWNADPNSLTLVTGKAFSLADSLLVDDDRARLDAIDAARKEGAK